MLRLVLVISCLLVLTAAYPQGGEEPGCPHGQAFIDECDNDCNCIDNKFYGCTRKACRPGQKTEQPLKCSGGEGLPVRGDRRVFCLDNIVQVQNRDDACLGNAVWKNDCNSCFCTSNGLAGCTLKLCLPEPSEPVVDRGDTAFCDGETECPADCSFTSKTDECVYCQCGPSTPLKSGEIVVNTAVGCPPGYRLGQQNGETQTCLPAPELIPKPPGCAHGPGFIDECGNDCSCVNDEFYGCTFKGCLDGQTSEKPMTCDGAKDLPKRNDKIRVFCHDKKVKFQLKEEKCVPGAQFMNACNGCSCLGNSFAACTFKACLPEEPTEPTVDRGDTAFCAGETECPADCSFTSKTDECVYCQCGPSTPLKSGEIVVNTAEGCPPGYRLGQQNGETQTCLPAPELVPKPSGCPHGPKFIDECGNDCSCNNDEFYACTFKGCLDGQTSQKPMTCDGAKDLPKRNDKIRVFCHDKKVKFQLKEEKCVPGAQFMNACNGCSCLGNSFAACTFKACLPEEPTAISFEDKSSGEIVVSAAEGCPPGYRLGQQNGETQTCLPAPELVPKPSGCPHGPKFIDECGNDCSCNNDEFYACTFKGCLDGQVSEKPMTCDGAEDLPKRNDKIRVFCLDKKVMFQLKEEKCVPGARFMNDCNGCSCTDSGGAACTFKACLPEEPTQTGCPYGPAYIDQCDNDFSCIDGRLYGFTRKGCLPGQVSQKPRACGPQGTLPERSNRRVFCHEGIVKLQSKDAACLPGAFFMDECNRCTCGSQGTAGCTLKGCFPPQPVPQGKCPKPNTFGICVDDCQRDDPNSCSGGQLCCSNGCGFQCMNPE